MAKQGEEFWKNIVYLMLTRYGGEWKESLPDDMGLDADECDKNYRKYAKKIREEIGEEVPQDGIPTVDELVEKGLLKMRATISSCTDPSKLAKMIETLTELPQSATIRKKEHKTVFDIIQEKAKNEK